MKSKLREYISLVLKGVGMGAANVIPGVSGGTIALITGIFERLIHAIKSLNLRALKLLFTGRFREFAVHMDLYFLLAVLGGITLAILSLARLLEYLFAHYPVLVWAYFFGLILASVFYVGRRISRLSWAVIILFLLGASIAVIITVMTPSKENNSVLYLLICGVVASCSMILPGLSGSFVLLLMGNYQLVMIESINSFDLYILVPVVIGAGVGLVAFSYFLSWVFKKYKDGTLALLTGFILGSLSILWPWKETISTYVDRHGELRPLLQKNVLPSVFEKVNATDPQILLSIVFMLAGIATIFLLETLAKKSEQQDE